MADLGGNAVVRLRWRIGWRAHPWGALLWFLLWPARLLAGRGSLACEVHRMEGVAVRLLPVRLRAPRPTVAGRRAPVTVPARDGGTEPARVELYRGEPPHPYRIIGRVTAQAGPTHEPGLRSLGEAERSLRERAAEIGGNAVIHVEARFGFRARPWATLRHSLTHWFYALQGHGGPPDFAVRLEGVAVEVYRIVTKPRSPSAPRGLF